RSEGGRLLEISAISDVINTRIGKDVLLLGDFNAMHRDSWFARLARSSVAHHVSKRVTHQLIHSMAERVQEMALGTTVGHLLEHTTLHDLDPGHARTVSGKQAGLEWMPSWRLAKIDWIFGSEGVSTSRYRVMKDVGSDHRPVIADITISHSNR
ncbi:MAG: endonuclease/exonuclease/phosphatase family protein, partial [Candidatus Saccharimonas sp.]